MSCKKKKGNRPGGMADFSPPLCPCSQDGGGHFTGTQYGQPPGKSSIQNSTVGQAGQGQISAQQPILTDLLQHIQSNPAKLRQKLSPTRQAIEEVSASDFSLDDTRQLH